MSKQELDNAIFKFDRPVKPGFKAGPAQFVSGELPPDQQGTALCLDIKGDCTVESERCAAKRVDTPRGVKYFVKWCMDGPDKGHLLNPNSIYFREGDDAKMEQRRGRLRYEFRTVSESVFNNYIKFLQTKTYSFCQAAEREILNG